MQYSDLIHTRRSIRAFAATPVEETKLNTILQAANRAPSAGNLQAYEIYVVRGEEQRRKLVKCCFDQQFIAQAPVALVFCTNPARAEKYGERGAQLYSLQDATIACTFALLAVDDLGLACVWVGALDADAVRDIAGAPASQTPVAVLPIGYGAEDPVRTERRALGDLVHEC